MWKRRTVPGGGGGQGEEQRALGGHTRAHPYLLSIPWLQQMFVIQQIFLNCRDLREKRETGDGQAGGGFSRAGRKQR